jgi:hypothetical protein
MELADPAGIPIRIDEVRSRDAIAALPTDRERGIGFLDVDGFALARSSQPCGEPIGGVERPGIAGFGGEQDQLSDDDDAAVVIGCPPLNVAHLIGQTRTLALHDPLARSYQAWVEAFARNHRLPIEWAEKGVRKEDHVRPWQRRMATRDTYGVYFIFKSMEQGASFRVTVPKYPTEDPNYPILAHQRSRFTHHYFYIRDEVLGPMVIRVASFLPFQTTYYLNGHSFIEQELSGAQISFRKTDNAFLAIDDVPRCRPPPTSWPSTQKSARGTFYSRHPRTARPVPVHDRDSVENALGQRDIGDVREPDLIDPIEIPPSR